MKLFSCFIVIFIFNIYLYANSNIENYNILNIELINNKLSKNEANNLFNYANNYLYTQRKYIQAINVYEKLIKYGNKSKIDEYLFWIAKTQFKNKNYSLCLETFNKIIYLYPNGEVVKQEKIEKTVYKILKHLTKNNEIYWSAAFFHFSEKFTKSYYLKNKRLIEKFLDKKVVIKTSEKKTSSHNGPIISNNMSSLSRQNDIKIIENKIFDEFNNFIKIKTKNNISKYINDNFTAIVNEIYEKINKTVNFKNILTDSQIREFIESGAKNFNFSILKTKYYLTTDTKHRSWGGEGEFYVYYEFKIKDIFKFINTNIYEFIKEEFNDDI